MDQVTLFYRFGVAVAIGILVGLQREHAHGGSDKELFAGVRTFALMSLLGCAAALAADELASPWGFVAVVVPMGALVVAAHFVGAWHHEAKGLTTETATLLTILAGALCYWDYLPLAAAVAVGTTVLLSLKPQMHAFAKKITREDVYATLKFAVVAVIVLPVLPNQAYGWPPLDVLNPFEIWLVVVLISGISFLGYVLIKLAGARRGITLTGLLGGLISSTPVTVSFAKRSHEDRELAKPFALAITVAWAMTYFRVMIEVAAVNASLLRRIWLPLLASALVGLAYSAYLYFQQRTEVEGEVSYSNPFELGTALQFGLLYAVVLLVSKAALAYIGEAGVYVSSVISGLPDADAVTLSMAQLSRGEGALDVVTASRAVVLGVMSNTVAKGIIVVSAGTQGLRRAILPGLVLVLVTGIGLAFFFKNM